MSNEFVIRVRPTSVVVICLQLLRLDLGQVWVGCGVVKRIYSGDVLAWVCRLCAGFALLICLPFLFANAFLFVVLGDLEWLVGMGVFLGLLWVWYVASGVRRWRRGRELAGLHRRLWRLAGRYPDLATLATEGREVLLVCHRRPYRGFSRVCPGEDLDLPRVDEPGFGRMETFRLVSGYRFSRDVGGDLLDFDGDGHLVPVMGDEADRGRRFDSWRTLWFRWRVGANRVTVEEARVLVAQVEAAARVGADRD